MLDSTGVDGSSRCAVVVPIRSFDGAKQRLAAVLSLSERQSLARDLAARVLAAAQGFATVVVTSDAEVRHLADRLGVPTVDDPGSLDQAARSGFDWAVTQGCVRVAIVHADLPFVVSVAPLAEPGADPVAILVPDQRSDGTPALSLPTNVEFAFAYGEGSFLRHCAVAAAAGLRVVELHDEQLGFDVDLPADLDAMHERMRL